MKKILLILLLNILFLFSEDSFIQICKNPTPEQKQTISAMLNAYNEFKEEYNKLKIDNPEICEKIYNKYNHGFKAIVGQNLRDISLLRYFTWVSSLNLRDNKITDITPLKIPHKTYKIRFRIK